MESKEEIFRRLGHHSEKYVKHINFLSQRINGCTHHSHRKSEGSKWAEKYMAEGNKINLPPVDYYEGDFNNDWEEMKEKRKRELGRAGLPLSIEHETELIKEFITNLLEIKNDYIKKSDANTIRDYATFMEQLNSEMGLSS
jgi:hypothetical protein